MSLENKGLASKGSVIRLIERRMDPLIKMRPEDIGVDPKRAKEVSDRVNVGSIKLIGTNPDTHQSWLAPLQAAGRRARAALNTSGLVYLGFEGARFVPYELQEALYETFKDASKEHDIALVNLLRQYDQFKNQALVGVGEALMVISGDSETSQAAYRRVLAKYPTKEDIEGKFKIEWRAFHTVGVAQGGEELSDSEQRNQFYEQAEAMIVGLRGEVIESLQTVMAKIAEGGKLRLPTVESAQRAFDRADSLNVLGDPQIQKAVRQGRELLASLDRTEKLTPDFNQGVAEVVQMLEVDAKEAVRRALENVTGVGRRKIAG
jgi:hypothetical protein